MLRTFCSASQIRFRTAAAEACHCSQLTLCTTAKTLCTALAIAECLYIRHLTSLPDGMMMHCISAGYAAAASTSYTPLGR